MGTAQADGRFDRRGALRWRPVVVGLTLALVLLVAGGVLGGGGTASAASHPRHKTHHTSKTPTPTTPAFALDITNAQAWSYGSQWTGYVTVQTVAGAALTIRVTACGRVVGDPNLAGTAKADAKGVFGWSWTAPSTTCRAVAARVTATSGGKTVTKSTSFPIAAVAGV
jgi:hypothetical protein